MLDHATPGYFCEHPFYTEEITRDTLLSDDLGLDGYAAVLFFEEFSAEFQVDLTGFDFHRYFLDDGEVIISFPRLFGRYPPLETDIPLTLAHLERVMQLGKWVEPEY